MTPITRTTDRKARVCLPPSFSDSTVIIEQISDTEIRIRKARVVPEDEFFNRSVRIGYNVGPPPAGGTNLPALGAASTGCATPRGRYLWTDPALARVTAPVMSTQPGPFSSVR